MPPDRLLWLEIAERQYLDLPDDVRGLVDERLAQLERDPVRLPDAVYDSSSDQWSATAGGGLVLWTNTLAGSHLHQLHDPESVADTNFALLGQAVRMQ